MLLSYLDEEKIGTSGDCISQFDKQLNIIGWNNACVRKYNLDRSKVLRQNLIELFPHIEYDYRVECLRQASNQGKSFFFANLPYIYMEGYYHQAIVPLRDSNQQVIGALNVVRDCNAGDQTCSKKDLLLPILKSAYGLNQIEHLVR